MEVRVIAADETTVGAFNLTLCCSRRDFEQGIII
jgi:hypothetical protein